MPESNKSEYFTDSFNSFEGRRIEQLITVVIVTLILLTGDLISAPLAFVFGVILLGFLILKFSRVWRFEISLILPLIFILIFGIVASIFHLKITSKNNFYLLSKDIWYYIKPIIYILLGFYLLRTGIKKELFLKILIFVTLFISIHHISRVILFISTAKPEDLILDTIRAMTGPGNLLEAFSFAFLIMTNKSSSLKKYIRLSTMLILILIAVSIVLSLSRTVFIATILSLLGMSNFFSFRLSILLKTIFKLVLISIFLLFGVVLLNRYSAKYPIIHSLTDKYLNITTEITYQKNYFTFADRNKNWRGIETHLTKEVIKRGNLLQRTLGFGFGKTVFVGYDKILGEENIYIPKFHNGYIEILLKTGYLGIIFYILFFYFSFKVADRKKVPTDEDLLLKSMIITSFITTLVITGLYNKTALDPTCLTMGYLLGLSNETIIDEKG